MPLDGAYGVPGDSLPAVSLEMTSPAGDEIVLTDASGSTYDVDGFPGESIRTFSVETPGDHILRVDVSGDSEVRLVMAVGKEPSDGVGMMRLGAVLAALAGLVLGWRSDDRLAPFSPKPAPGGVSLHRGPPLRKAGPPLRQRCPQHRLAPEVLATCSRPTQPSARRAARCPQLAGASELASATRFAACAAD